MNRKIIAIALSLALTASVIPESGVVLASGGKTGTVTGTVKVATQKTQVHLKADDSDPVSGGAASGSSASEEDDFTYEVTDDYYDEECVIIKGYNSWSFGKTITVPDSIDGYPVRIIEYGAFSNGDFQSVELPDTLRSIGGDAFADCKKLKSVVIPAEVSEIGAGAFESCEKLKSVVFKGNKLTELEDSVFSRCKRLESINIPNSVKNIDSYAFYRCSKLESVQFGNKLKTIGQNAFEYNFALKSVSIPASVELLENDSFRHCTELRKVKFSGKHTKIDKSTFDGCTSLKKIVLSDDMKFVPEYAFYNCKSLKKVKLSKNTKLIKKCAFKHCESLKKISFGRKMYAIGDHAFEESGLKSVKLNKNLQYIGNGAFAGTNLKKIKLTEKVSYIGNRVFAGCRKLKTVSIPASVKGLNPGALGDCVNLTAINVSAGNKNYSSAAGVLFDKNKKTLLQYPINKKGSAYTVPSSVDMIRSHAFENNKHLTSVSVSAEKIHNHAFANMSRLKRVVIGNGVKNIAERAFAFNDSLSTVEMADSVNVIARAAFEDSAIRSIRIPSGIDKLSGDAFDGCTRLAAFEGSSSGKYPVIDGVLYENGGKTLREYPRRKPGSTFTVPSQVTRVKYGAFRGVKKLKKLYFESSIKDLASSSIVNCPVLKEIVFAEGTKLNSGWSAVSDCDRLAVIVGPKQSILASMAGSANATLITL